MQFLDAFRDFRPIEIIDIALVSMLVYALIRVFRGAAARFIARGLLVLAPLFLVARVLGLQLVASLFEVFFAVLLVLLIVLFQEEIRRVFERIGAGGILRGRKRRDVPRPEIDVLASVLPELARDRVGALVVLEGEETVLRHLSGGVPLNGDLSEALLLSIFDPHSQGHDGAVLISEGKVKRFACHLPLSEDTVQLSARGTRHAAALGLSERCDALCLIVSEERGTISAAEAGRLRPLEGAGEIVRAIEGLRCRTCPPPAARRWSDAFRRHLPAKAAAVIVTCVLWFLLVHEAVVEYRSFPVAVRLAGVEAGESGATVVPGSVKVVVSGPRRAFYFVEPGDLSLTLFDGEPGEREVMLTADNVRLPSGLTFVNIVPRNVRVTTR